MNWSSFLSRMLGRDTDEDQTRTASAEAIRAVESRKSSEFASGEQLWDRAFELVVEAIDDLPPNFPQDRADRIVKRTLAAAGIEIGYFNRYTWARVPQINSKIELARRRLKEFQEKTEKDISSLEREIRKARETYGTVRAKEEEEISSASKELENIKRVRAFFGFSDLEGEENISPSDEETQILDLGYADGAQQAHDFFSSHPLFGTSMSEGEENTGPRGEGAQVRDSLDAAWAQIETFRAQLRQRSNQDAYADRPTRGPAEGSSRYSEPHDIGW